MFFKVRPVAVVFVFLLRLFLQIGVSYLFSRNQLVQEPVNNYVLSTPYMPDTVLGTRDLAVSKRGKPLLSGSMHSNAEDGEDGQ